MVDAFDHFESCDSSVKPGLPAFAYTCPDFRAVENRTIFSRNWVFVGFAHLLKEVGDVQPVTVGGKPIFLVRNDNNEIAAFHNACRHRCLKLVDQAENRGRSITCPYHAWTYSLQGALESAPFFGGKSSKPPEAFSFEDNGLVPVRCETWHDWVFVNLDNKAGDIKTFLQPLKTLMSELPLDQIEPVSILDFGIVKTNWKFLMENFIEPYHVQFVHKTTTKQPLRDHYTIAEGHCLGSGCDIEEDPGAQGATMLAVTSRYLTLFPNFVLGAYAPDQLGVHLNIPVSADETRQYRVIYLHKESNVSASHIQQLTTLWYDVHKEDHEMCERLQQGRASDVAISGGSLSPHWETSVRRFQELVVEATSVSS